MRRLIGRVFINVRRTRSRIWWAVRQIFGDAAYENYLRSVCVGGETAPGSNGSAPLSPADFYLDSLRRRYSRISRCC